MKRLVRSASILVAFGLLFHTLPVPAFAFTDVKASTQYSTAIDALQKKGILQGYADGSYKSTARINRAEFLKIVIGTKFTAQALEKCDPNHIYNFPDASKTAWYAKYLCVAVQHKIVGGYPDGKVYPERNISFTEASKVFSLAYEQNVQNSGGEWYEGYVSALESSKAIPPSIAKLDALISRGEMAEMMWRLSEGKTDQPSKGLLNLRNPTLSINTSSDSVQYAKSCAELQTFASAQAQVTTGGMYLREGRGMMEADTAAAPAMQKSTANGFGGDDYSQTNVQVEGVDEADIVKTDGTYLYILSARERQLIRIVRATPASSLKQESVIDLTNQMMPTELYVEDGKLIVIGTRMQNWDKPVPMLRSDSAKMIAPSIYPWPGQSLQTEVRIYNVANASAPVLDRTIDFDGNSVSSRRIGTKLYLVLQQPFNYWGGPHIMESAKTVPQFEDSRTGVSVDVAPCNKIAILPRIPSPEYMTVAVIPVSDKSKEVKTTVVLGNAQNIYASLENLYVATPDWNYVWDSAQSEAREQTRLYRFAFTENGVELKAQGNVPGRILNQFSMDESTSTFRIATTIGQSWDEQNRSTNNLYVLNMNLERMGAVTDIAPGETIYSVRFVGNRAYMVTFKTVDPFFVLDLKDPKNPKVLGALKIPGFSNYLHPYDENHVIGFGKDVDESIDADKVHSTDAIYYTAVQGLKIALFDVTDVANPKQKAVEVIGDRGTDSPLLQNHKALLFEKDRGSTPLTTSSLLAFPILVTKRPAGTDKSADGNAVFQGTYVYDVSANGGFKLRGTITHYENSDEFLKAGSYWYGGASDIERIVRVGSQLLTISGDQIKSSNEVTVKEEGNVMLK